MNKLILVLGLFFSVNSFAIDLSIDIVVNPMADAKVITQEISERGALRLTPVECKKDGDAQHLVVRCGTTRRIVYPDNTQDESFGGIFEYTQNANGTWTRTAWECPIL